jgi:hypothetical protein
MHDEDEEIEDGFQISDDENMNDLEGITDFGLDEEDPDKDR